MPSTHRERRSGPLVYFVIMPFTQKHGLDQVWRRAIQWVFGRALVKGLCVCERADDVARPGDAILERIFTSIEQADVVIADLTSANPNVFLELGYALGLKKECILISQSVSRAPFDVNHNHILQYNTTYDGIRQLRQDLLDIVQLKAELLR